MEIEFNGAIYPVTFVDSTKQAIAELAELSNAKQVAIDTETVILLDENGDPIKVDLDVDGPGPWRVLTIAAIMADGTRRAWCLDMGYISAAAIAHQFAGVRPFGWNTNFDRLVLARDGIFILRWWDGMYADAVLRCGAGGADGRQYRSLAAAVRSVFGIEMEGKNDTRLSYKTIEEEPKLSAEQIRYATFDVIAHLEVALRLGEDLKANGLVEAWIVECNAQPFIHAMIRAGLPMIVDGYQGEIDEKAKRAAEEAERIAVATNGRELLDVIVAWDAHTNGTPTPEDPVAAGLELLHDNETFTKFLADVAASADKVTDELGELLGTGKVEDLFNDNPDAEYVPLPFQAGNDTSVRAWLSKQVPHFTAAWVLSARDEGDFATLLTRPYEEVKEAASRRSKFTKDHDVDVILAALAEGVRADVTEQMATVAVKISALRRYTRILDTYGERAWATGITRLVPTWNVNSDAQVKDALNTYCPDLVRAYAQKYLDGSRLLEKTDSVDADALKLIGGELCEALLAFRAADKVVTTYGDDLLKQVHPLTGRIHAKYKQALTGTGRLSSYKPNAQNLSPLAKPYLRPVPEGQLPTRVCVAADLSQAELRFVADAAQDENMLSAFASGEDLHARTASLMFSVDLPRMKEQGTTLVGDLVEVDVPGITPFHVTDGGIAAAALYGTLRQKAKQVAFGYAYGLKGGSLSNQLTVNGVPTTKEEADELLAKFDVAYPQVAAWMNTRVEFIANLAKNMRDMQRPSGVDFTATWMLHLQHGPAHRAYRAAAKELGYSPEPHELVDKVVPNLVEDLTARLGREPSEAEVETRRADVAGKIAWALSHEFPVALADASTPWEFESRTKLGRRRRFQVRTDHLMMSVVSTCVRSRNRDVSAVADEWLQVHNDRVTAEAAAQSEKSGKKVKPKLVSLTKTVNGRTRQMDSRELEKAFEDKELRTEFVRYALSRLPAQEMERLWRTAMADRIRAMSNQYRNHPIQGGVADAMLVAFSKIIDDLAAFDTAMPIQSVHDSIVIECNVGDALAIREMVVRHMEESLAMFCPTVKCVADGDIQLSLDAKTICTDEQVRQWAAEAGQTVVEPAVRETVAA